jgi:Skp family chaperone for outer membrane proteins
MRSFRSLSLLAAAMLVSGLAASRYTVQATTAPVVASPPRIGFVSMAGFMKNSEQWQAHAATVNVARAEKTKELMKLRDEIYQLGNRIALETGTDKDKLQKQLQTQTKEMEAAEAGAKAKIDELSMGFLREMKSVFDTELKALAKERKLDVVMAYSANEAQGLDAESLKSAQWLEMYFRPSAAMPLYVGEEYDLTAEMVKRFEAKYAKGAKPARQIDN